jgi:hypothetical protein
MVEVEEVRVEEVRVEGVKIFAESLDFQASSLSLPWT